MAQGTTTASGSSRHLPRRTLDAATGHPVLAVVAVALVVRIVFAVLSFLLNATHLIGDEVQYVQLADAVASGRGAESWVPFYGQSLYNSTWTFCAPLAFLFKVFGTSRIWGQLLAASAGAAIGAITTRLALEAVRPKLALGAGLLVALLPSQVLWSSLVLRESTVWMCLGTVGLGVAVACRPSRRALLVGGLLVALGLLGVAFLRQQTLVAAAWSVVIAAPFLGARHRWFRSLGALALALAIPIVAGIGPGGWTLVQEAVPSLATTRTYMSLDAQSSFTSTTLLHPATTLAPEGSVSPPNTSASGSSGGGAIPTTSTSVPSAGGALGISSRPPVSQDGQRIVDAGNGEVYSVDEGLDSNAKSFVPGLIAVTLRPFPWEWSSSIALRLAAIEDLAWYALYVGAAAGLVLGWRRHQSVTLFAFLLLGNILGIGALTQGNLGTAFRHRGQFVWALAVLSAVAVEEILTRRQDDGAPEPDDEMVLVRA